MRRGHVIAVHLCKFENKYDEIFLETKSKEISLRDSMNVFRSCPGLCQLTNTDYERIVEILKVSLDPKKIISTIVLKMDSQTSLKALKNEELLTKMAEAGKG